MENVQLWNAAPILRLVSFSPHHRTRHLHWHEHPFYEVGLVLGGRCDWRLGPRRLSLRPGEAILLRPRTHHCEEIASDKEARLGWIGFEFDGKPPAWCHRAILLEEDASEIAGYFDAISREHHLTDARSRRRITLALQSLLLVLERRAEGAPKRSASVRSSLNPRQVRIVESAAHYFRCNLRQPLGIAQVASYHSLCPAHFSSLFRRHHRVTPRGFLRQSRIEHAAGLLTESDLPLKDIAAQCGFVDAAHLCKSFKREHRLTPNIFRNRMRKPRASVIS